MDLLDALRGGSCPPRPTWFDDAACRSVQTAPFFAGGDSGAHAGLSDQQRAALAVCARCPVQDACRAYGRRYRMHGIWGGETELERARSGYGPSLTTGASARAAARARREVSG